MTIYFLFFCGVFASRSKRAAPIRSLCSKTHMNMRQEHYSVVNGIPNSGRGETAQPTPDSSYVTPHSHLEITTMKDIGPRKKRTKQI